MLCIESSASGRLFDAHGGPRVLMVLVVLDAAPQNAGGWQARHAGDERWRRARRCVWRGRSARPPA
jgi:hypothetical protein